MTLLDRVRTTITKHHLIQRAESIVLGISGGPDSLALAHLLRALRDEWHIQIHLAHLNHQLRGADSDADAEFIAWLAREWNLPATIEARDVAASGREKKLSVEEAAREMRYEFLSEVAQQVGARTIVVAHHADDQAETVLMRLLRGAGMAGLRGMEYQSQVSSSKRQAKSDNVKPGTWDLKLVRPLLDVTRAEIEAYCKENDLHPRDDLSNNDTTLFRNRLRQEVLPYLETLNPNLREVLLHTSRALADDYDFLQSQVSDAFAHVAREENGAIIFDRAAWCALHPSLQRGTLRVAVERLQQSLRDLSWTNVEDARIVALQKNAGAVATLPRGLRLTVGYGEFLIAYEMCARVGFDLPQLSVECIALAREGAVELPESRWTIELVILSPAGAKNLVAARGTLRGVYSERGESAQRDNFESTAFFDAQKIRGEISLRRRKPGDTFQPAGMNGHAKSLHEFMIDEKIPQAAREQLPLLCDSEKILWVCGYRADERVRVTDATREVTRVTMRLRELG